MFILKTFLLLSCLENALLFDCQQLCDCRSNCNVCRNDQVTTICLKSSSYYTMGYMYGSTLAFELNETLTILKDYYAMQNVSYNSVVDKAQLFFDRYKSVRFIDFLFGMANGSGMTVDDCKVLNGMETLGAVNSTSPDDTLRFGCAFAYVPPETSSTNLGIIARNYDYGPPFGKIAGKNVIVTIIADGLNLPIAIVGMPGQIYCPTCINSKNVFVELNNGAASGGGGVVQNRTTLLIKLLEDLQKSDTLEEMSTYLRETDSDYSLIINLGDAKRAQSFEFSNVNGVKPFTPFDNQTFVSTNFFLNRTWNLPPPKNIGTSIGVTRRNNLLNLLDKTSIDVNYVKFSMDVTLQKGGAQWIMTIYQIVYDTSNQQLFVRSPHFNSNWTTIELEMYFSSVTNDSSIKIHTYGLTFSFFAIILAFLLFICEFMTTVDDYWN